ncbi:MAG: ATP-binding protein [bacterium]
MKAKLQVALIVFLVLATTGLHYAVDLQAGATHDILQRFYYVPVILGGLWFGTWGGLATAFCIALIYFPHAYHGWHGPQSLQFRLMEILMYHVVGGLTGFLSSRLRTALETEKRTRLEKETAYQHLREKTEELFTVEEQLRRTDRLAALGRLTAGLAHEIRNPLASIKTSVEIMRDQHDSIGAQSKNPRPADEETPDFYKVLLEETDRLDRTLTNFLSFAKAEEGSKNGETPSCQLSEALAKTAGLLEHQMAKRSVEIHFDADAMTDHVMLPESHMRQIFLNLFLNSFDALPDGGHIKVAVVERKPQTIAISVEDSGPGIPVEIAAKIFDPFFSTKQGGTGLGLSIVERILSSSGGRIELETRHSPSSRFRITLPLCKGV